MMILRDWVEDQEHENGNYQCQCWHCKELFIGHKRRVFCKHCSDNNPHDVTKPSVALGQVEVEPHDQSLTMLKSASPVKDIGYDK